MLRNHSKIRLSICQQAGGNHKDQPSAEKKEASDSPSILFLRGEPGLGKSTFVGTLTKIRGNG